MEMFGSFQLFAGELFKEKRHTVNLPCTSSFDFGAYYQDTVEFPPHKAAAHSTMEVTLPQPCHLIQGIHAHNLTLNNSTTTTKNGWPSG